MYVLYTYAQYMDIVYVCLTVILETKESNLTFAWGVVLLELMILFYVHLMLEKTSSVL